MLVALLALLAAVALQVNESEGRGVNGAGLRLAIAATIYLVDPGAPVANSLCGLIKWCADAARLAAELPPLVARELVGAPRWTIDVVLSTNASAVTLRAECSQPNVVIEPLSAALLTTVRTFTARVDRRGARRAYQRRHGGRDKGFKLGGEGQVAEDAAWLSKWAMVGLTRYDLILQLDLDVDLVLPGHGAGRSATEHLRRIARAWAEELPRFVASGARMLASLGGSEPVNMGSVWLRPSAALYAEGVAVLERGRFSLDRGFDDAGAPRALLPAALLRARSPLTNRTMADSEMIQSDSWNFVAGASDQGLFVYVFAMRPGAGRGPLFALASRADSVAYHYYGRYKPWRPGHPSCPAYSEALGLLAPSDGAGSGGGIGRAGAGTGALATRRWQPTVPAGSPPPSEYVRSTCWPWLVSQAAALARANDAIARSCRAHQQLIL
jgi:hypothetical protein